MDGISAARRTTGDDAGLAPYQVVKPDGARLGVVVASPHSGSVYPAEFVAASQLDPLTLRRSEDCYVDELFAGACEVGAPLIRALFPRAYVDVNREPFELDPRMFEDALPGYVTTRSPRVTAGLGTIARVVANGCEIYGGKLRFAEALRRITTLYRPYHAALGQLVAETRDAFGFCVLVDAHSMPSHCGANGWDGRHPRADFVIGDRHGLSCEPCLVDAVEATLASLGYRVARNDPYPGGYTTRHYGRPEAQVHALQIEISRSLYMDESTLERLPNLAGLRSQLARLVAVLGETARRELVRG